jgi:pyruvate/2-oxoacid:ferredoxin oxidoreductase alpha subunit
MARQLMKGNEAIAYSAILAGCRAFYGYPITPSSEIAEAAALYLPRVGGVFLQAESEVAAINMMYGAAAAGVRVMTASSGPGISLMQEGISYMACAELPCVIADVMRAGPGLGNVGPEQGDYLQVVKGGGHGNYRTIVLAPASAQEAVDLTRLAFELADEYRNPAYVLMDACVGQVMEPVEFPRDAVAPSTPEWAVTGTAETRKHLITSIYLDPPDMERHILKLEAKYRRLEDHHTLAERYRTEDAEIVLVGYGIVSRVLQAVVEQLREHGLRVGMLRPITLFPFPSAALREIAGHARAFVTVEMSTGQMVDDVRLALNGRRPVEFYGRCGGVVPSAEEVIDFVAGIAARLANEEVIHG